MNKRTLALALILSFVLGAASIRIWISCTEARSSPAYRGTAVESIPELVPEANKSLALLVLNNYREYRGNATRWSAVYFGSLFGAAALSAFAALLLRDSSP